MGKIAFVFSGQGAQAPGMGRALHEASPAARRIFDAAERLRPGTSRQCFEGTEELRETANTQPCLVAMELAAAAALAEAGVKADMAAGFSLGELSALSCAGALDFDVAFSLVCLRGKLMQRASEQTPTAMAAVLKLTNEQIEQICSEFEHIWPVNYNCPGQVTVSGLESEMQDFYAAVRAAGGWAMPLKVRGAFHSPYMKEASDEFGLAIDKCDFCAPEIPVYANYTAMPYGADVAATLREQMCHPVRWEDTVRNMISAGADTFVELGPGRTLCGLIGKTDKSVRCFDVSTPEDIAALPPEVRQC